MPRREAGLVPVKSTWIPLSDTVNAAVRSIGSYWPYASTLLDYIRRAMPFGAAQTLTNDELYAITAYVLFLNDVIKTEDFELSDRNFGTIKLPNEGNFFDDDRETSEKAFWRKTPCMTNCAPGEAKITGRARAMTSGAPPTMRVSVPETACSAVLPTGLSIICAPLATIDLATFCVVSGSTVLMSM